jgi:hypothetical protein
MLYYLLIPVLIGIWPLLVFAVYLPATQRECQNDYDLLIEGQTHIMGILEIDPERIRRDDPNQVSSEFAYGRAVDRAANLCSIPASNCIVSASNPTSMAGKKRQDATIKLKDVSIVQVAKFLSTIQSTWVNLQCDQAKLTRRKGMPDQWEVDFRFIYYY